MNSWQEIRTLGLHQPIPRRPHHRWRGIMTYMEGHAARRYSLAVQVLASCAVPPPSVSSFFQRAGTGMQELVDEALCQHW
jgi:hypothetical protein